MAHSISEERIGLAAAPREGAALGSSHTGARVLVVDDEPSVATAYQRILTDAGFAVQTATNGRGAAQKIAQQNFDVVVSDISMPEMDGITLLRAVRERDPDVPVILVTGAPSLATAQTAIEYGALRYLCKPVDLRELIDSVKKAAMLMRLARLKREAVEHVNTLELTSEARALMECDLDRSLAGVWMAYQPIVRYSTRTTFGYEGLLRSTDATFPGPAAIIACAERLERLDEVGRLVRRQVAETIRRSGIDHVFVNVHPKDLLDDELFHPDAPLSRIAPRVVLEITERAALDDIKDVHDRVQRLRALGYRIAVDDIGAGYAALTSVANLQPEVMKIDIALVRNIDTDPVKKKLVRAMVTLCQDMQVAVIAEGIETEAERDTINSLGCDLLQGYLFGRPERPFSTARY